MASFSSLAKAELARLQTPRRCCRRAELAALVHMDGSLQVNADQVVTIRVTTENAAVARKVYRAGKDLFGLRVGLEVQRRSRLQKNNAYVLTMLVNEGWEQICLGLGIGPGSGELEVGWPPDLAPKNCCRRAYLRGAFLGGGSVNHPHGDYHLEILARDRDHGRLIAGLMAAFGLEPGETIRKGRWLVYLKEGEQVAAFLNVIGAHNALLQFEDVRIHKEMRNHVNRLVNCETANVNKTVEAGLRQVESIRLIRGTIGLDRLPGSLRATAELRLEYPDISLQELGQMLTPSLGKSGVNHRLRRLDLIAQKIKSGARA